MIKLIKKFAPAIILITIVGLILLLPDLAHATPLATQVRSELILRLWRIVLGVVNIAAILGLIFIAFVNILRINIEAFNIRRMLPALILGIIFANFSHLICRIPIDFAQIFTNFLIQPNALYSAPINNTTVAMAFGFGNQVANGATIDALRIITIVSLFMYGVSGFLIIVLFALIIVGLPTLLVFVFAIMMYVRLYVIWFLVIMSPIAFFALFFEPIKMIWSNWWSWFAKWLFLAPVGFFFLRLAVEVGQIGGGTPTGGAAQITGEHSIGYFATWVFGLGMVFFALYVPFTWGGTIMNAYKGLLAKGLAGYGWGKKIGGYAAMQQGKRWSNDRSGGYNRFKNALGGLMQRGGKSLIASPIQAARFRLEDIEKESQNATATSGFYGYGKKGTGLGGSGAQTFLYKNMAAKLDPSLDVETLIGLAQSENVILGQILNASSMPQGQMQAAEVLRGRLFARLESGDETARAELEHVYAGAAPPTSSKDRAYYDRFMNWQKTSYRRTQQVAGAAYTSPGGPPPPPPPTPPPPPPPPTPPFPHP